MDRGSETQLEVVQNLYYMYIAQGRLEEHSLMIDRPLLICDNNLTWFVEEFTTD